jgi:site-specific recombinase XerD
VRVTEITTSRINLYINKKIEEGKANATINRDLSALKRMFHLIVIKTGRGEEI